MKRGGFSVIELLIVIAILVIIALIAIPNLLSSRIDANQGAALAALRTINRAEFTYKSAYNAGYTSSLVQLGPPASGSDNASAAGLIESALASGTQSGYAFSYVPLPAANGVTPAYTLEARPLKPGSTGRLYYFTDESNVIRQNGSKPATLSDSPVGG